MSRERTPECPSHRNREPARSKARLREAGVTASACEILTTPGSQRIRRCGTRFAISGTNLFGTDASRGCQTRRDHSNPFLPFAPVLVVVPLEVVFKGHPHGYNFLFVDLQGPAERVSSFLWKGAIGAPAGLSSALESMTNCSRRWTSALAES